MRSTGQRLTRPFQSLIVLSTARLLVQWVTSLLSIYRALSLLTFFFLAYFCHVFLPKENKNWLNFSHGISVHSTWKQRLLDQSSLCMWTKHLRWLCCLWNATGRHSATGTELTFFKMEFYINLITQMIINCVFYFFPVAALAQMFQKYNKDL